VLNGFTQEGGLEVRQIHATVWSARGGQVPVCSIVCAKSKKEVRRICTLLCLPTSNTEQWEHNLHGDLPCFELLRQSGAGDTEEDGIPASLAIEGREKDPTSGVSKFDRRELGWSWAYLAEDLACLNKGSKGCRKVLWQAGKLKKMFDQSIAR